MTEQPAKPDEGGRSRWWEGGMGGGRDEQKKKRPLNRHTKFKRFALFQNLVGLGHRHQYVLAG